MRRFRTFFLLAALCCLSVLPAFARSHDDDDDHKAIRQSFARVGLLTARMCQTGPLPEGSSRMSAIHVSVDVMDDTRLILPSGFLFSLQAGLGSRGWVNDDNYLQATQLMAAMRPGLSLRLHENRLRLDLMTGLYLSYDLWGTQSYEGSSVPLRKLDGYNRFDFGLNFGASFVIWKFEIYTELRQGICDVYKNLDAKQTSMSWCVGIGWNF